MAHFLIRRHSLAFPLTYVDESTASLVCLELFNHFWASSIRKLKKKIKISRCSITLKITQNNKNIIHANMEGENCFFPLSFIINS